MSRRVDKVVIGNYESTTLVAVTAHEKQKGLMFKEWPPPAMVFPSKRASISKFWMKNTPSPLDIIFCRSGKVVDIQKGNPYTTTLVGPNVPVDLVVELPYGTAQSNEIKIGDSVKVKYSLDTLLRLIKHSGG